MDDDNSWMTEEEARLTLAPAMAEAALELKELAEEEWAHGHSSVLLPLISAAASF